MSESQFLGLPLLEPSQAQKHVTVNEALVRLDGVAQLTLEAIDEVNPPTGISGAWGVGAGATNAWFGQDGRIAIAANGGWEFVTPLRGWRAWVSGLSAQAYFDGASWITHVATLAPSNSGLSFETIEIDQVISAGPTSTTSAFIPSQSLVFGVTGRVLADITGTATSFSLGVEGESVNRYGSGIGLSAGAWLRGLTSSPLSYYSDTALTLTPDSGDFSGGTVRLSVHRATLRLPQA